MAKHGKANNKAAKPAKKTEKKKQPEKKPANLQPRQKTLPGMQDRRIAILENAALDYAEIRDERMTWTQKEVEAKKRVQKLMHDQDRTHYERGNIEIDLVPEGEHVRVRVRDSEESVEEPPDYPPEPAADEPKEGQEPVEDPDKLYDSRKEEKEEEEPHF